MRQFPLSARTYIWTVIAAGAAAFVWAFTRVTAWEHLPLFVIGCVLAVVAAFRKVNISGRRRQEAGASEGNSTISLGFVPTFLLLLLLGPFQAMLAGALNAVGTTCHPRRSYYYQVLFSVGSVCLSVLAASLVLRPFGLPPPSWDTLTLRLAPDGPGALLTIAGIGLSITAYYLVNTVSVAGVISLISGQNLIKVWRGNYVWVGFSYYVGASCATLALGLIPYVAAYPWTALAIGLVAVPLPACIFYVFKYHRLRELEKDQHIADLQTSKEALERSKAQLETSNVELERSKVELEALYNSTVESLALAIDAKDRYTKEHIQRVREMSVSIAREIGLVGDDLRAVETGALLHDIGKLAVPEHILTKPGRLTEEEFAKIKSHPEMGAHILQPVNFPFPVLPTVRSHHERWDGTGYPDGLAGPAIPLGARILAVADVYDALTMDRPYRLGWPHEEAVQHIRNSAGTHFDPEVVKAFLAVIDHSPRLHVVGSVVQQKIRVPEAASSGITRASFEYMSLYAISETISVTQNLQETLSRLAGKIRQLFNASTCVLFLKGEDGVLYAQRAVGVNDRAFDAARVALGDGLTGRVAREKVGVVGPFEPDDLVRLDGDGGWKPLHSMLIAPLLSEGEVIGTVNLYHERAAAFEGEDLHVLQSVAAQAGRAICNAREYDRNRESAFTDPLTGLYNARHLSLFLEREIEKARREHRSLTVLVLDLDNFKPVNDRFGHARGNEVLRDLGAVFQSALRSSDLVARYAGDEFVIVLPGAGPAEACVVMDKVRAAVAEYDPCRSGPGLDGIRVGVSLGAATFPADGADAAALIASADRAMYRDKNQRKAASGRGGKGGADVSVPA